MNDLWTNENEPVALGDSFSFVPGVGEITDIAFRGIPLLRGVQTIARDTDWGTYEWQQAPLRFSNQEPCPTVIFPLTSVAEDHTLQGEMTVTAERGVLNVTCAIASDRTFSTNRSGLTALHFPQVAGQSLTVIHPDGSETAQVFPEAISPFQPAFRVAGYRWSHHNLVCELHFQGDVFEMEDQRNWTDASYKTYSRPLDLPFPYEVAAHEQITQSLTLRVSGIAPDNEAADDARTPTVIILTPGGPLPEFSLGASSAPDPQPALPTAAVPDTLVVELDVNSANWRAALERAASSGSALDARLVVSEVTTDPAVAIHSALEVLADAEDAGTTIQRIGIFSAESHLSTPALVNALREAMVGISVAWPIVGGTRAHFTELNRGRDEISTEVDHIAFSSTPLFHQRETRQLIESVAIQRLTALQAVEIARSTTSSRARVAIGPVTVRPRFINVATTPRPTPARTDLSEGYGAEFTGTSDPRQQSPELAAWLVASAAAFAVPGVSTISFCEQWGPRGIINAQGEEFPVASAFAALKDLRGTLLWSQSPDGLVWALGAEINETRHCLIANLCTEERHIEVHYAPLAGSTGVTLSAFSFTHLDLSR